MAKGTVKKFAIGTMMAALVGYVAGLLTAPKSGKETRQDIKDKTEQTVNEAEKQLKKLQTQMDDHLSEAKQRLASVSGTTKDELKKVIDTTKLSRDKVRELLHSIGDGESDNRDLQQAIDEAEQAVDHLKRYLKPKKSA